MNSWENILKQSEWDTFPLGKFFDVNRGCQSPEATAGSKIDRCVTLGQDVITQPAPPRQGAPDEDQCLVTFYSFTENLTDFNMKVK